MNTTAMTGWIGAYGAAWSAQDADAFANLFAEAADYFWTPYEPKHGRREIAAAFRSAVETQRDVRFGFEMLHTKSDYGLAHWWCAFSRLGTNIPVQIDGIMQVRLDRNGQCFEFREWWHKDEAPETLE